MTLGEIAWVDLPFPADRKTSEQAGRRPAVVVQDEQAYSATPTVVVVPLTSKLAALRFPGTLLISRSPANGLTADSVALVCKLTSIDRRRVREVLGMLSGSDLKRLQGEIASLLALPR